MALWGASAANELTIGDQEKRRAMGARIVEYTAQGDAVGTFRWVAFVIMKRKGVLLWNEAIQRQILGSDVAFCQMRWRNRRQGKEQSSLVSKVRPGPLLRANAKRANGQDGKERRVQIEQQEGTGRK